MHADAEPQLKHIYNVVFVNSLLINMKNLCRDMSADTTILSLAPVNLQ